MVNRSTPWAGGVAAHEIAQPQSVARHQETEPQEAQPRYQDLDMDDRAFDAVDEMLITMPSKGARKEIRVLARLVDELLPYLRHVLREMACRSEALSAAHPCGSWTRVWKPLSEQGYDTVNRGLVCIDYGNREYAAVLALFAALDQDVKTSLERLARFWPTVSLRTPYTEASCERRGDIIEIFMARLRGDGKEEFGGYLEGPLPELFTRFCLLMRLVQKLDSWETGWLKWKQVPVQPMRAALPCTAPFINQWGEGSHRWPSLLIALYRLLRHLEEGGAQ